VHLLAKGLVGGVGLVELVAQMADLFIPGAQLGLDVFAGVTADDDW
jgi:hypothetical protein